MADDIPPRVAAVMQAREMPPGQDGDPYQASATPSWWRTIASALGMAAPADPTVYGARLSHYPDAGDVANARRWGVGYGTPNSPYTEGVTATALSAPAAGSRPAQPVSVDDMVNATENVTRPELRNTVRTSQDLMDSYMAAQTAISRSPISALGYDPRQIAMDLRSGPTTVAGFYNPKNDSIYSNAAFPGNMVHESTHRGLEMLRKSGAVPAELWKRLPEEESIVRYIMALHMGDPEKDRGALGAKERGIGLLTFGKDRQNPQKRNKGVESDYTLGHLRALNELTDIAARVFASKQPGGGVLPGGPH